MLGWEIQVCRQPDGGSSPATLDTPKGRMLAAWLIDAAGIIPFYEMAAEGEAIDLGGNGYPSRYTAQAKQLLPRLPNLLSSAWELFTPIDEPATRECGGNEWLIVEAWDQS